MLSTQEYRGNGSKMHVQKETKEVEINPDLAGIFLKQNKVNRRLDDKFVRQLVRDIQEGHWNSDNPHPIMFDWDGRLILVY